VERDVAEVRRQAAPVAIDRLRCAVLVEGAAVAKVHRNIESLGRRLAGKRHEISLSNSRKATPARWKTIIRRPVG